MFTRTTKIDKNLLRELNANKVALAFFSSFNLDGLSLDEVEVRGDYKDYVKWLEGKLVSVYKFISGDIVITDPCENEIASLKNNTSDWVEYTYSPEGGLLTSLNGEGYHTWYSYDNNNNELSFNDSNDKWSVSVYDKTKLVSVSNDVGNVVTYNYDPLGKLLSVNDTQGVSSMYNYDTSGNMTSRYDTDGKYTIYTYDLYNRLINVKTEENTSVYYAYDTSGNLIKKYDIEDNEANWTYNENGDMLTHTNSDGYSEEYLYDYKDFVCAIKVCGVIMLTIKIK